MRFPNPGTAPTSVVYPALRKGLVLPAGWCCFPSFNDTTPFYYFDFTLDQIIISATRAFVYGTLSLKLSYNITGICLSLVVVVGVINRFFLYTTTWRRSSFLTAALIV